MTEPNLSADPDILIVEDNKDVLAALGSRLRGKGYVVAEAATFNQALDWIHRTPPTVILDLNLPGGEGEALIGEFKRRTPEILVIVFTAEDDPQRLRRAVRFGANETLVKPVDNINELTSLLPPPAAQRRVDA